MLCSSRHPRREEYRRYVSRKSALCQVQHRGLQQDPSVTHHGLRKSAKSPKLGKLYPSLGEFASDPSVLTSRQ